MKKLKVELFSFLKIVVICMLTLLSIGGTFAAGGTTYVVHTKGPYITPNVFIASSEDNPKELECIRSKIKDSSFLTEKLTSFFREPSQVTLNYLVPVIKECDRESVESLF